MGWGGREHGTPTKKTPKQIHILKPIAEITLFYWQKEEVQERPSKGILCS
jgi:hypothetical protein